MKRFTFSRLLFLAIMIFMGFTTHGFGQAGTVSGIVWDDLTPDGYFIQNTNSFDEPLKNVTVQLYRVDLPATLVLLDTKITDSTGMFAFKVTNPSANTFYRLKCSHPATNISGKNYFNVINVNGATTPSAAHRSHLTSFVNTGAAFSTGFLKSDFFTDNFKGLAPNTTIERNAGFYQVAFPCKAPVAGDLTVVCSTTKNNEYKMNFTPKGQYLGWGADLEIIEQKTINQADILFSKSMAPGNVITSLTNNKLVADGFFDNTQTLCLSVTDHDNANAECVNTIQIKVEGVCNINANSKITLDPMPDKTIFTAQTAQSAAAALAPPNATTDCSLANGVAVNQYVGPTNGTFPIGSSQVCFMATDDCGTTATCCMNVNVVPTILDLKTVSPDFSLKATAGKTTAKVSYDLPTASSSCPNGLAVQLVQGLPSGADFPVGTTAVCYLLKDDCGNEKTVCFNVTVEPWVACDVKTNGKIQFELFSFSQNPATLEHEYSIRVTNQNDSPLNSVFFQLPTNVKALAPLSGMTTGSTTGLKFMVQNTVSSPFHAVKFSCASLGLKKGESEIFTFSLAGSVPVQKSFNAAGLLAYGPAFYLVNLKLGDCFSGSSNKPTAAADRDNEENPTALKVETPDFTVFPNPSSEAFFIQPLARNNSTTVEAQIFDSSARLVQTFSFDGSELSQIRVADWMDGIYTLRLVVPNQRAVVKRLIVQH